MKNSLTLIGFLFLPELRACRRSIPFAARFLLVLVAIFYGLMSYANIVSTSHNPAIGIGHDTPSLVATHAGGHGHFQDEPVSDENRLGHHDADHSHDSPNLLRSSTLAAVKPQEAWDTALQILAYPAPCFAFERPPRHLPMS